MADEHSEIDVEELLAEIREKLARRKGPVRGVAPSSPSILSPPPQIEESEKRKKDAFDFSIIRSAIVSAETQADVGATVSPMHQFPGPLRRVALLAGKVIVYLSRFMTDKQRAFNGTIIHVLKKTTDSLESLQREMEVIEEERARVKKTIRDLELSISRQERRLALLQKEAEKPLPEPFPTEE